MSAYWWGVLTPFAVAAALALLFVLTVFAAVVLHRLGFFTVGPKLGEPSDYFVRHSIVWRERWRGPIFYGRWEHAERDGTWRNVWFGVGRSRAGFGCAVGHKRRLR